MRQIIFILLLVACGKALAASIALGEASELKAELSSVQHEQQSVYQNYQMVKELRRNEVQEGSPPMAQHPYGMSIDTPPPDYDDVLRAQLEREDRIRQYTSDLGPLTERSLDLEAQRKWLLKQIQELEQSSSD